MARLVSRSCQCGVYCQSGVYCPPVDGSVLVSVMSAVMPFATLTVRIMLCMVCVAMLIRESNARPPWINKVVFTASAECHTDDELLDLCQRCAKLTKSKLALPACCSTDLQARKWCSDYVYFGRGEVEFYSE